MDVPVWSESLAVRGGGEQVHRSARDVVRGLFVAHYCAQLRQECQALCGLRALLAHLAQELQQFRGVVVLWHAFKARD